MPSFIECFAVVEEIIETDRNLTTFNCKVNMGNNIGTVFVSSFLTPNLIDSVNPEDVIQIFGAFVIEDGLMRVRASILTVVPDVDVSIRPANVILIGESDKGKIFVEQYFEKEVHKFGLVFDANEASTKNVSKFLKKGKLAVFIGAIARQEGYAAFINEIQLLSQAGPASPSSKELVKKETSGSGENVSGDSKSSDNASGRRSSKRKINWNLDESKKK